MEKCQEDFACSPVLAAGCTNSFHDKLLDNMRGLNYIYKHIDRCMTVLMPFLISTTLIVLT
jgi:hypothetical protein